MQPKLLLWGSLNTMRNYFAIAFIIVYLILTVGVAKSTHYCMGRLNNTTLFSFDSKKCACSLFQDEPPTCCHDEHEIVKLDSDQQVQLIAQIVSPSFFLIETFTLDSLLSIGVVSSLFNASNPIDKPPCWPVPIFKMNCSFTFYS
jgi:hypothetical protein